MSNPSYTLHILLANGERDRLDPVPSHEARALGPLTAVTGHPDAPAALGVRKWKWPAGTWLDAVATSAPSTDSLTDETKEHSPPMNEKPAIDVELPRATTIRPTTSAAADIVLRDTDSIHVDGRGALIVTGAKGEVKATCAPRHWARAVRVPEPDAPRPDPWDPDADPNARVIITVDFISGDDEREVDSYVTRGCSIINDDDGFLHLEASSGDTLAIYPPGYWGAAGRRGATAEGR